MSGYTGRKLKEYTWIPKSKTYLREYREFLKVCKEVQDEKGYFNDKLVGKLMVKKKAIVDRDSTPESYIKKYKEKSIGNQSYVSNARMMIRICRWLGWMTIERSSRFKLTKYGKNLTKFTGTFPSKIGSVGEYILMSKAFAKLKFYNVNDTIRYRNKEFKQRIFINMLRVLNKFDFCSHYELVVSAFVLKDERKDEEVKKSIDRVKRLKKYEITIREAFEECGLDCEDKSTVTGVYDGPKVMLSFAKQFGFVDLIPVSSKTNPKISELYQRMYMNSGHIRPKGIKLVFKITEMGRKFLKQNLNKKQIWYDELENKIDEASLICILNHIRKPIEIKKAVKNGFQESIENLLRKGIIKENNGLVNLNIDTDFDYYQDVPYEARPYVLSRIKKLNEKFLEVFDFIRDRMDIEEYFIENINENNVCINCAEPQCKVYPKLIRSYGASDRFSSRVCPVNIIKIDEDGSVEIDSDKCVGCMLCLFRCPLDAIYLDNSVSFIRKSQKYKKIKYSEKLRKTKDMIGSKKNRKILVTLEEIKYIIDNFEKKISIPGKEWKKDEFYVFIRNIFREFNLKSTYSGSAGMKTRSDVTIFEPFIATAEVKSPSEGPINLKAVRQSFDAAIQSQTNMTMAIGTSTHKGAIEQEKKYSNKVPQVKINLIESKYLFFLFLIRDYINLNQDSIERLLKNNHGFFDNDRLINFIKSESKINNIDEKVVVDILKVVNSCF